MRFRLFGFLCYLSALALGVVVATEFLAAMALVGQQNPRAFDWLIAWGMGLLTQLGLLVVPWSRRKKLFALIALILCAPWALFLAWTAVEASISPNHLIGSTWLIACAVWGTLIHGWATVMAILHLRPKRSF